MLDKKIIISAISELKLSEVEFKIIRLQKYKAPIPIKKPTKITKVSSPSERTKTLIIIEKIKTSAKNENKNENIFIKIPPYL